MITTNRHTQNFYHIHYVASESDMISNKQLNYYIYL